jgi:23S rRNA (uracil1939-C5)-methyltransferase
MRPDLVVVDPPRAGLERRLAESLVERDIERLTYVSCDPTTLARDLRILTGGRLRIVDAALFDLFPQTHHVETVVRLAAD